MGTRQHLIEQDCRDKLGWSIERVASATEQQMIHALTTYTAPTRASAESSFTYIRPLSDRIIQKKRLLAHVDTDVQDRDLLRSSIEDDTSTLGKGVLHVRQTILADTRRADHKAHIISILGTSTYDIAHSTLLESQIKTIKAKLQEAQDILASIQHHIK